MRSAAVIGSPFERAAVALTPLGRIGTAADIAPVVVFLAADAAAWVTGERITTSAGYFEHHPLRNDEEIDMTHSTVTGYTHQSAPTQYVEANGIRFAYRRFGNAGNAYPLLFNQHYTGTMDYWDPAVTDGLAQDREVILFDNAGISSSGEVPASIGEMATNAIAFVEALGIERLDVLGFSIGGMVAQEFAVQAPALVRRLILIGTGLRGGIGIAPMTEEAARIFGATYDPPENLWLTVHFAPSASSQAAGREFLKRRNLRQFGRDPEVSERAGPRQIEALGRFGVQSSGSSDYLKGILQPTLVVNGHKDVIGPTINSYTLQQTLPNSQLVLCPDANHGSFMQYHELFVEEANHFLESTFPPAGITAPAERLPFPTLPARYGVDEFGTS